MYLNLLANTAKLPKVEGMETIVGTATTSHSQGTGNLQGNQQQTIENGNDGQILTSTPIIKSEVSKMESFVSMDLNSTGDIPMTPAPTKTGKRNKGSTSNESKYILNSN